jgi:D-alanyl-D-alanine carboxypeptidase/D-alanyl-D-alanine-endopeptidase (penicillin-binding protein 4)
MRRWILPLLLVAVFAGAVGAAVFRYLSDPGVASAAPGDPPVTPVLSARRLPQYLAQPGADARLAARLEDIVARTPPDSCLSVEAAGRFITAHNPETPLVPASTEKLLVARAALTELGPDTTFRTTAVAGAAPANGVIAGDLVLVGSGDPVLSTASWRDRAGVPETATSLEELADSIAAAGVTRIDGRVLGDDSRYDTQRYVDRWPSRFIDQNQTGPLSALTVNQGFTSFPSVADTGAPETPASDPPAFAAAALTNLLVERGVTVGGQPAAGAAPAGAVEIAAVESPPLFDIVSFMTETSDNMTAEMLVKELGAVVSQDGSTAGGTAAVASILGGQDLPLTGVQVADGSGLAPGNRTTCTLLSGILEASGPQSAIAAGMAVAGESGTLIGFLDGTDVEGRLRAKTGSLNDVRALAGFVEDQEGGNLAFSFVINEPPYVTPEANALRDELGLALGTYPELPDLAAIGPQRSP